MKTRRGFTLIELLIVIVVMGILSSMMMISSSESTSTARANNIISNLRNFSMAAMAFYTDSMDTFGKAPNTAISLGNVTPYMHNEGKIPDLDKYIITNDSGTWWAGCNLNEMPDGSRIKEKLASRAASTNLMGSSGTNDMPTETFKESNTVVWLKIRSSRKN